MVHEENLEIFEMAEPQNCGVLYLKTERCSKGGFCTSITKWSLLSQRVIKSDSDRRRAQLKKGPLFTRQNKDVLYIAGSPPPAHLTSLHPPFHNWPSMKCLKAALIYSPFSPFSNLQGPPGASGAKGDMVNILCCVVRFRSPATK